MKKPGRGTSLNTDNVHNRRAYVQNEETKQAARKIVCSRSADSREAAEFMQMLGIHPNQTDSELDDVFPAFNTMRISDIDTSIPHTPPRLGQV